MGVEEFDRLLQMARAKFGHLSPDQWSVEKARLEGEIERSKAKQEKSVELTALELELYLLGIVPTSEGGGVGKTGRVH